MQLDDINISEYFDSAIMPYGMKITHLPTGLNVRGNCKHEQSKLNLQKTLMDTLSIFVAQVEGENVTLRRKSKSAAELENEELKARLARLEAALEKLAGGAAHVVRKEELARSLERAAVSKAPKVRKVKPESVDGRAAAWTPERRVAAAQRMKDRQAAKYGRSKPESEPEPAPKVDTPLGPMSEQEFVRRAMRPATDPPQRLPKSHESHGQTVVKSNVDWIKP
jgi:hypothetical protein